MPFYHCLAPTGVFTQPMKQEIVDEITRIHCDATGALALFIQIQFEEVDSSNIFQNRKPSSAVRLPRRSATGGPVENAQRLHGHASSDHEGTRGRYHGRIYRNPFRERHGGRRKAACARRRGGVEGSIR